MVKKDRTNDRPQDEHRDNGVRDVREAVDEQDRDRERRIEEWKKRYQAWLDGEKDDQDGFGEHGEPPPVTPFLLIRYGPTDLGARPIPAGTAYWASPDVWVESSDPYGNAVAGEPNTLHARIFNLGAFQAAPVQVDFYWANPALGLGPANMNHIGTEWVEVPSLGSVDVACTTPWIPVMVNNGHECAMVNCSCWISDPILYPFQPTLDRHVGQRNLNVVAGKAGMKLLYTLQVTNVFPIEMPVLVTAVFERLTMTKEARQIPLHELGAMAAGFATQGTKPSFGLTDRYMVGNPAHRLAQRGARLERRASTESPTYFRAADTTGMTVMTSLTDRRGTIDAERAGVFAGNLFASLDAFRKGRGGEPKGTVIERFSLDALSFRMIDVQIDVPTNAERGDIFITHLFHHAGPWTVGGYAIAVVIE